MNGSPETSTTTFSQHALAPGFGDRVAAPVAHARISPPIAQVGFSVEDDGGGFDPAAVQRGAGLDNLADRVAALGGILKIDSRPGGGTRITGYLPA